MKYMFAGPAAAVPSAGRLGLGWGRTCPDDEAFDDSHHFRPDPVCRGGTAHQHGHPFRPHTHSAGGHRPGGRLRGLLLLQTGRHPGLGEQAEGSHKLWQK